VDVAQHVTQRGNARRFILDCDADREVYLGLLREDVRVRGLTLVGYCLMSNHVHLVVIPHSSEQLSLVLGHTHGRYASYWNARHQSSGHVWHGRYCSCPMDEEHLWQALRYTELNPVRSGLVGEARLWKWSSAGVHCGGCAGDDVLASEPWSRHWTAESWQEYLSLGEQEGDIIEIRRSAHTGRPLGTEDLVLGLE
jgi:putative transposase